ncbi:MAG: nuclear transport factor 2 family protein [Chakrabartia godavariana]
MTPTDILLAEHACAKLITEYAALLDAGQWDAVAALYVPEGRMSRPTAPDDFIEGRAAILASFTARPPRISRHVCVNIRVEVTGADTAQATSQILLFTADAAEDGGLPIQSPAPPMVGTYAERLVRTEAGWRFAERRGSLDFRPAPR